VEFECTVTGHDAASVPTKEPVPSPHIPSPQAVLECYHSTIG
jgi:hypothetical protein